MKVEIQTVEIQRLPAQMAELLGCSVVGTVKVGGEESHFQVLISPEGESDGAVSVMMAGGSLSCQKTKPPKTRADKEILRVARAAVREMIEFETGLFGAPLAARKIKVVRSGKGKRT